MPSGLLFLPDLPQVILMIQTEVKKTIHKFNMFQPGDKVVVGVSGGADSICLLNILKSLKEYKLDLIVAHLNHGLRGAESDRDEKFVEKTAGELGLFYVSERADVEGYKSENNLSTEDAARQLRYRFFQKLLKEKQAHKIATAHNLEDQAETVLIRFLRGSGSQGLSGIPPVNNNIVRPLIEITREEIKKFLISENISWVEDSSNSSTEFTRNRIRHELLPVLKEYNPRIAEVLARSTDLFRSECELIDIHAESYFDSIFTQKHFGFLAMTEAYKEQHKALRYSMIRKCIEKLKGDLKAVSLSQILSIDEQIHSKNASSEFSLPGSLMFSKGHGLFVISESSFKNLNFSYRIDDFGESKYENEFTIITENSSDRTGWLDESVAFLSSKKIDFPITVRSFKPGDRFRPLGSKGFKKIKDYFIDQKVPRFLRKSIPVFESGGEILWVGGFRVDERYKVGKGEDQFIKITVKKPEINLIRKFQPV